MESDLSIWEELLLEKADQYISELEECEEGDDLDTT